MPLLEETGFMPTRKYAFGTEIREHTQRIAKHFNLYEKAFLHTECKSMRWSDENSNWTINTDVGDVITARFVVLAAGTVHRPKFPAVPGLNSFKGHSFHTSRWDYKYTGGDQTGNLSNLKDKRVGIIGTGATSVQAVPHLGAAAKELYVFQRTPSGVSPRGQQLTDPKWAKSLGDKWQNERVVNFTNVIDGTSQGEDLVQDGWTAIVRDPETGLNPLPPAGAPVPTTKPDPAAVLQHIQIADFKQMEKVRKRCDDVVKDKETAEKLKPYYNKFCKR
jgi:cyclohexanone monooxygenase